MANDLEGSGLGEAVAGAARAAGYDTLTPIQAAALPVLRRGGNAVLHASTGAGVTGAFALPLLDRLAESEGGSGGEDAAGEAGSAGEATAPVALVLAPTPDRADALAQAIAVLAGDTGLSVRATGPGWRAAGAAILVMATDRALADVQQSALKLDGLQAVVFTDLSEQFRLRHGEALDTLVGLFPKEAQRVVTTAEFTSDVEKFVEGHVRRALTVPARAADPTQQAEPDSLGQIGYIVVSEGEKAELAARLLEGAEGDILVFARTPRRAERVHGELGRRGITAEDGVSIRVAAFSADVAGGERVLSYDVPFSAEELRRLHAGGGTVMVTPAELDHFRRIAKEAPFATKQRRARVFEPDELETFREGIRSALAGEDIGAQLLVLEPLFDEHSPAEVAAALSALLRRRTPPRTPGSAAPGADPGAAPKAAMSAGFARLFVSIGARDNVRPADIVGAITGEAGIKGDQVGRVDIRDTFSVVEVAAVAADKVIRALNGTTMRGRSLRVDFDRKTGGGGDGGARRTQRPGGPGGAGGARGPGGPRTPGGSSRGPGGSSRGPGGGSRGPGGSSRGPGGPRKRPPER